MIDLTHTIIDNLQVYPGDENLSLTRQKDFSTDKFTDFKLITGMHAGTHIDGPMHLTQDDRYISSLPLTSFVGKACVINTGSEMDIKWKESYSEIIKEKDIIIINTGFGRYFGTVKYLIDNPVINESFAAAVIERGIKMIGIDLMSPDSQPHKIHKMLLSAGILIAENLANLDRLSSIGSFEVIALPLKINSDSSPARIIARKI